MVIENTRVVGELAALLETARELEAALTAAGVSSEGPGADEPGSPGFAARRLKHSVIRPLGAHQQQPTVANAAAGS